MLFSRLHFTWVDHWIVAQIKLSSRKTVCCGRVAWSLVDRPWNAAIMSACAMQIMDSTKTAISYVLRLQLLLLQKIKDGR